MVEFHTGDELPSKMSERMVNDHLVICSKRKATWIVRVNAHGDLVVTRHDKKQLRIQPQNPPTIIIEK